MDLTFLSPLVILLLGLYAIRRISQVPVSINVTVLTKPFVEPIDESLPDLDLSKEIKDYIALESDEWAKESRTKHAKKLLVKLGSQEDVLRELKREDYV